MPQSLARLNVHLIFSTKNRERVLTNDVRDSLHRYASTVLANQGCHHVFINSVEDHVHILFDLGRTCAVSVIVKEVKTGTSQWIKTQGTRFASFAWQAGYAAFAVDMSSEQVVREYISKQREHHHTETFQEEYRRFLTANGIEYDERYVWD
jgi:REP element-mobilizing transposase RayT